MLVTELKESLKKYHNEDLKLIIREMYKSMPKKLREEKGIDIIIQDIHAYVQKGKTKKAVNDPIDIDRLKLEI